MGRWGDGDTRKVTEKKEEDDVDEGKQDQRRKGQAEVK
jgi:hypothetical protein